ncbi:Carnitine monooxygenase oxygenase subunit [Halioglobus japonicus]|nr:Carnitine monooxygenase oxygenase subunit [Halioglobus japonicus]
MTSSSKFKYTIDQPLPEHIPVKMLAPSQETFTSSALFERELSTIFDSDWVMMGRAGSIPEPGDYFTAQLGKRPIILMRQKDSSIKAMGNYCLHRYTQLLTGCGSTKNIVCPYHYWSYALDGQLEGVPNKQGFCPGDLEEAELVSLACEVFMGYIFVSLKQDRVPVSTRLAGLAEVLSNFGLERYEDHFVEHQDTWNANWKLICHNFIESYHVTYTHKKSIGPTNPTKAAEYGPVGEPYHTVHSNSYAADHFPEVFNTRLDDSEKTRFYVMGVFPNGLIAIEPNFVWWMALEPVAANKTNSRWGVSFLPETLKRLDEPEQFIQDTVELLVTATSEDKEMVERMQRGSMFGAEKAGPLHAPLEIHIKDFDDYIRRQMASA